MFRRIVVSIVSLAAVLQPVFGALYTSFADVPHNTTFDFIIVGGGTAGNVVANRLTENPSFSVLVLEAGPSPEGLINYTVPMFNIFLRQPNPRDWNYTLTAQAGLNGRTLFYPRGRVLGGCSSMNGLDYVRGSSEDYDRYAKVTGDDGWSWSALQPYIQKSENWNPPTDNHNTTGQFNPAVHGFHGMVGVELSGYPLPQLDEIFMKVSEELPEEYPFNLDTNSGFQLGVGWPQATTLHGHRSSSFTSYLAPEFLGRKNLHVVLNTQVTKLIQTNQNPIQFLEVEFAENRDAPRRRAVASKEIIVSAGTLETPKLLLNSGIGNNKNLSTFGVPVVVDLPDVGQNLSVHMGVGVTYFVNSTETLDDMVRNLTFRNELLKQWEATNGGGPLGFGFGRHSIFSRLPKNSTIFDSHPDPAAGPKTAHFQRGVQILDLNPPPEGHFNVFGTTIVTPTSRGTVRLNTTNAFDNPLIDIAALNTGFDIFALKHVISNAQNLLSAPAWKGYILEPLTNISGITTDAELEEFVRDNAAPNCHIVGTASMSPKGATYGVVDPDLTVKGVEKLRVVDASVLPFVPAGNTVFAVYMVGERGADLIKSSWQ